MINRLAKMLRSDDAFVDMERELRAYQETTHRFAAFVKVYDAEASEGARNVPPEDVELLQHRRGEAFAYRQMKKRLRQLGDQFGLELGL